VESSAIDPLHRCARSYNILEIDVGELLAVVVADDQTDVWLFDEPGWREATSPSGCRLGVTDGAFSVSVTLTSLGHLLDVRVGDAS
jgi:hypothetical protein